MNTDQLLLGLANKVRPEHTALLIVDMQNDFCSPGGFIDRSTAFDASSTDGIVGNIQRLREAAAAQGVLTIHITSRFDEPSLNAPARERLVRKGMEPYCVPGTWGAQIIDALAPAPDERTMVKSTYDGFYGTDLDAMLAESGIATVVVTGLATDNCVAATAKGAFYRGYYVALPADACTSGTPQQQSAALTIADHAFAEICDADTVCSLWNGEETA